MTDNTVTPRPPAEPLELEDVDDTATDDYPLPDYAQAEAEPW